MKLDRLKIWEIETTYDVNSIYLNQIDIWPWLRELIVVHLNTQQFPVHISKTSKLSTLKNRFCSLFYCFKNWFKKSPIIAFSVSSNLSTVCSMQYDRYLGQVLADYPQTLLVEYSDNLHPEISNRAHQRVASFSLLIAISLVLAVFIRPNLKGESILNDILNDLSINESAKRKIKSKLILFYARYCLSKFLFKLKAIKIMLCTCHYLVLPELRAAKELGIKVIEFQHGLIDQYHISFIKKVKQNELNMPTILVAFGEKLKPLFKGENCFIGEKNVIVLGSFIIDFIQSLNKLPGELTRIRNEYNKVVVIPSVSNFEKETIDFVKETALLNADIAYLYYPRTVTPLVQEWIGVNKPPNIFLLEGISFYEALKITDCHATTFSTTAIEALSFGVKNVFISLKSFESDIQAKDHFLSIIGEKNCTTVNSPETFLSEIQLENASFSQIRKIENKPNYELDYYMNYQSKLQPILNEVLDNGLE